MGSVSELTAEDK